VFISLLKAWIQQATTGSLCQLLVPTAMHTMQHQQQRQQQLTTACVVFADVAGGRSGGAGRSGGGGASAASAGSFVMFHVSYVDELLHGCAALTCMKTCCSVL
jgi:hypothetical protein